MKVGIHRLGRCVINPPDQRSAEPDAGRRTRVRRPASRLAAGTLIWWVDPEAAAQQVDPDLHKGAIQGDRPDDEQQGNPNVPALDESGLPAKATAIAEDRIGANVDDNEVANADETGRTTSASRDEVRPLD